MSSGKRQRDSDADTGSKHQKTSETSFVETAGSVFSFLYSSVKEGVDYLTAQVLDDAPAGGVPADDAPSGGVPVDDAPSGGVPADDALADDVFEDDVPAMPMDKFLHSYNASTRLYELENFITLETSEQTTVQITCFSKSIVIVAKEFVNAIVCNMKDHNDEHRTDFYMNWALIRVLEKYLELNHVRRLTEYVSAKSLFQSECADIDAELPGSVALAITSLDQAVGKDVDFKDIKDYITKSDFTYYPYTGLYLEFMLYLHESDDKKKKTAEGDGIFDQAVAFVSDNAAAIGAVAAIGVAFALRGRR
jgi:hypothetical protein